MTLYFEDLSPGQTFTSRAETLDEAAIIAFARAFDPQPFHTDSEAAKDSFFGGLAASGWHTASLTMRLIVDSVTLAGGVVGAGVEIAWTKPVRPGDALYAVSEVLELNASRSKPDRGMAVVRTETRNQRGEVVQVITSKLVVIRRPA